MGGFGSGRQPGSAAPRVEHHRAIDLADLRRRGMLEPGYRRIFLWTRDRAVIGSINVFAHHDWVLLGDEFIARAYTPTRFGGQRSWFVCRCGRRVRVLYYPRGKQHGLACRVCQDLRYWSQSEPAHMRAWHRAKKLKKQVYEQAEDFTRSIDDRFFAPKPHRMRQKTYDRLIEKFIDFKVAHSEGMEATFERAAASLDARDRRRRNR